MQSIREFLRNIDPQTIKTVLLLGIAAGLSMTGAFVLWAATLTMPSLESVESRRIEQSTKIYDRTGEILLYDLHQDVKRTIVPFEDISHHIKNATVAIEDANFYNHKGVEPTAIIRAVLINLKNGNLLGGQGGSTITQQVVKNSLLETEKKLSRKFKEWILAIRLDRELTKEEILEIYLNESPYGGTYYGVEEASQAYFGVPAKSVTLAQAAYIAALPQAPTRYSPYGNNRDRLEARKNLVLERMLEHKFITQEEFDAARAETVEFLPQKETGIKAPHFVFYVIEELEERYGKRMVEEGGLKVITTIDWPLQAKAEEIVERHAKENKEKFNAENGSIVAIDPKTGEILTMVGSRDYFDEEIDGAYNIALAHRQPGSAFKPFAYAAALIKGYTTETVVFDVPTQFSTACAPDNFVTDDTCYSPKNYDNNYRGPMTLRNALAQSVNVPAVKVVYLAGLNESIALAERMGITTLAEAKRYGLTLVLGGGEVSLLEMTSAYGTFANDGIRYPHRSIVRVEGKDGEIIDEPRNEPVKAIDRDIALSITDILTDNVARAPAFGGSSFLYFPERPVAAKTGTTNDYRDAWIMGYTKDIAVGAWAGNNDNSSMEKKVAGFIVAPMWNEFMHEAFKEEQYSKTMGFDAPPAIPGDIKPILRGVWQGGDVVKVDKYSGKLATDRTPPEAIEERYTGGAHSILFWVDRNNPRGPMPSNPDADPQYRLWEYGVQAWMGSGGVVTDGEDIPDEEDDVHTDENAPEVRIRSVDRNERFNIDENIRITLDIDAEFDIEKADFYVDDLLIGSTKNRPFSYSFSPEDIELTEGEHKLKVVVFDEVMNQGSDQVTFEVRD